MLKCGRRKGNVLKTLTSQRPYGLCHTFAIGPWTQNGRRIDARVVVEFGFCLKLSVALYNLYATLRRQNTLCSMLLSKGSQRAPRRYSHANKANFCWCWPRWQSTTVKLVSGGIRNAPLQKRLCGGALRDESKNGCVGDSSYVDGEKGTKTIVWTENILSFFGAKALIVWTGPALKTSWINDTIFKLSWTVY